MKMVIFWVQVDLAPVINDMARFILLGMSGVRATPVMRVGMIVTS